VAGLAAVVGHDWPVFAGFRGGRGVAVAFGALLGIAPFVALVLMPIGLGIALVSRYMSLMSISGGVLTATVLIALAIAGVEPWAYAVYGGIGGGLLVVLHRENIQRLLAGTEPKIGRGGGRGVQEAGRAT
jgi:glycerol-3-phosphate acyltransferase PlsY